MDETSKPDQCPQCGAPLRSQKRGRPRKYCSTGCRQRAYEERQGLPNWKQEQTVRQTERQLSKLTRRRDQERLRRSTAVKLELEHKSHTDASDCVTTIFRFEMAMAAVIQFASYLVLEADVGEEGGGVQLGRAIQQLVDDVKLTGFRAIPENDTVETAERRWAEQGGMPGRSRIVTELNRRKSFDQWYTSPSSSRVSRP